MKNVFVSQGISVPSDGSTRFINSDAYYLVYTIGTTKMMMVYAIENNTLYCLIYTGSSTNFDAYLSTVNNIKESCVLR
jgi:hypothetical protein